MTGEEKLDLVLNFNKNIEKITEEMSFQDIDEFDIDQFKVE